MKNVEVRNGGQIERFQMHLKGTDETWAVSINHQHRAVKISMTGDLRQGFVVTRKEWGLIAGMQTVEARRAAVRVMAAMNGEAVEGEEYEHKH